MDALSINAASGMRARLESLEMLANNLANASTSGYKNDREFYNLYTSDDALAGDASPGTLPVIEKHWIDYSQGTVRSTGNALDLALDGRGFFAVNGPTGILYTRDGSFRLNSSGVLTTSDGMPVRSRTAGRPVIQTVSASPINVLRDGTVEQDNQAIGQLQIDAFNETAGLNKRGLNYFYTIDPAAKAQPSSAAVLQSSLESSNTGPAEGAVRLISIMRQFEMLQKAMNIGADMNQQAVQEVAKVGS